MVETVEIPQGGNVIKTFEKLRQEGYARMKLERKEGKTIITCFKSLDEDSRILKKISFETIKDLFKIDSDPPSIRNLIKTWSPDKKEYQVKQCLLECWTKEELEDIKERIEKRNSIMRNITQPPRAYNLPVTLIRYPCGEIGILDGMHRLKHLPNQRQFAVFIIEVER